MSTGKGILALVGLYAATAAAAVVTTFVAMLILSPKSCSDYGQTAGVIWLVVAVLALASTVVAGIVARKAFVRTAARVATVVLYAAAMLLSYLMFAFMLMVAFNC